MHPNRVNYHRATGSKTGVQPAGGGVGKTQGGAASFLGFMPLLLDHGKQAPQEIED